MVARPHPEGLSYALAHDRMAEVVVRMVESEGGGTQLLVDRELLALRRLVTLKSALHQSKEQRATRLSRRHYQQIEAHADALLWDEDQRAWWAACRKQRRVDRLSAAVWTLATAAFVTVVAVAVGNRAGERARTLASLEQIASGKPDAALRTLELLLSSARVDTQELRTRLRLRANPMDVLERGLEGVSEERRNRLVLEVVEIALPLFEDAPENLTMIGSAVWALDFLPGREVRHAGEARRLRDAVLAPLRRRGFPG